MSIYDTDEEDDHTRDASPKSIRAYVRRVAREQDRDRAHILRRIVDSVVPGIIEEARHRGDSMQAYGLVSEAVTVVDDIDMALHPTDLLRPPEETKVRYRMLIWHRAIQGYSSFVATLEDKFRISKEELESAAGEYMARPWMQHDYIDWCIVDALVRWEWAAFYNDMIHSQLQTKLFGDTCKWLPRAFMAAIYAVFIGLPAWGIYHLYAVKSYWATPSAILLGVFALWEVIGVYRTWRQNLIAKFSQKQLQVELLLSMRDAYHALGGSVLSPTRVRTAIQSAADKGVIWSQVIWPVIDAAVSRNPDVWKVSPPHPYSGD